jgi:hypothetical protein
VLKNKVVCGQKVSADRDSVLKIKSSADGGCFWTESVCGHGFWSTPFVASIFSRSSNSFYPQMLSVRREDLLKSEAICGQRAPVGRAISLGEYSLIKRKPIGASWAWLTRSFVLEWLPSHLGLVGAHLSASRCRLSQ